MTFIPATDGHEAVPFEIGVRRLDNYTIAEQGIAIFLREPITGKKTDLFRIHDKNRHVIRMVQTGFQKQIVEDAGLRIDDNHKIIVV